MAASMRLFYKHASSVSSCFYFQLPKMILYGQQKKIVSIAAPSLLRIASVPTRTFSVGTRRCDSGAEPTAKSKDTTIDVAEGDAKENVEEMKNDKQKVFRIHDVQTSIKYLNSKAYRLTYGDALVWQPYRRNHKGATPPETTRKTCIRKGIVTTGNPCPICRDEYLVLHPENVALLKQFIMPTTGKIIDYQKTGLCQVQHKKLLVVIEQAWDAGYIDAVVPFRHYDYEEYYPQLQKQNGGDKRPPVTK